MKKNIVDIDALRVHLNQTGRLDRQQCEDLLRVAEQAWYATTEACVICDKLPAGTLPKRDGCAKCHVGKLIKLLGGQING